MEGGILKRSATSFRRQGSSGLVWDDKFLSGELKQNKDNVKSTTRSSNGKMQRSRSEGGAIYRTVKVSSSPNDNVDPPSPKVSGCGCIFGKPVSTHQRKSCKR
ncbi:hypothetical protein P3X46_022829 [Hevea brasiliensis]|uniref:MAPK kinase substrate protein n=1 Tax=Hevea brasiliensis TaxID=3981 RepID=A0ABQ9LAR9_HEVBR|nr:MAPK kinase substrate protein At1g80180-like [Hevea brasiliensis]KAJ9163127.1 hypothetical protein P3X46_022829 [Hevea brasiliensis]